MRDTTKNLEKIVVLQPSFVVLYGGNRVDSRIQNRTREGFAILKESIMPNINNISIEFGYSIHIKDAIAEAIAMANKNKTLVTFSFNSKPIAVREDSDPALICRDFDRCNWGYHLGEIGPYPIVDLGEEVTRREASDREMKLMALALERERRILEEKKRTTVGRLAVETVYQYGDLVYEQLDHFFASNPDVEVHWYIDRYSGIVLKRTGSEFKVVGIVNLKLTIKE